jgi:hypothetical protein
MTKVDVAICVYGKPYNTAVTLASLIEHSGRHIGRIFMQQEKEQPHDESVQYLPRCFPDVDIVHYVPKIHLGNARLDVRRYANDADYRLSIRYQYAFESSRENFLFVTHNDCLFHSDVIGDMVTAVGTAFSGAGIIGQCWNCPAYFAGVCDGTRHEDYQPTYEEAIDVIRRFPSPRTSVESIDRQFPTSFPECRLGEFACLINLAATRTHVVPQGAILPFGAMTADIGTTWFTDLRRIGHRFKDYRVGFKHAPFSDGGAGDPANTQRLLYDAQEDGARTYLRQHYPATFDRVEVLRTLTTLLKGFDIGNTGQSVTQVTP